MTAVHTARRTAHRVARSNALEKLTRGGFLGYGLLHLAVAWLAVQIALGRPAEGDQGGAFEYLAAKPLGTVLLVLIAVGLAAMALWQLLLAFVGHRAEHGFGRVAERVTSAARAVVYAALAWTAYRVVAGAATSNAAQTERATANVLSRPAGQALVTVAGLVVVAIGVGMIWYGAAKKFEKRLMIGRMSRRTRTAAVRLGQAGYVAKGIAFGIVGVLFVEAASTHDPARSRGLDAALRALLDEPYGPVLLILVAVGFAAFGLYCFLQSRYRKVKA